MALFEPSIVIRFEADERETTNVKSYRINSSYTTATDGFEFTLFEPDPELVKNLLLQPVQLHINGNLRLLGRVEKTSCGDDGRAVRCMGRDYIADMVECHIDPAVKLKQAMPLDTSILVAAATVGITEVIFDNGSGWRNAKTGANISSTKPPGSTTIGFKSVGTVPLKSAKLEEHKANPGQGIYAFCKKIASQHGATIQPTAKRTTVELTAPDYEQEIAYSVFRTDKIPPDRNNNMLSATVGRDFTKFPTHVLVTGKAGGGGKTKSNTFQDGDVDISSIPELTEGLLHLGRIKPGDPPKEDTELYRLFYQRDQKSKNQAQTAKTQQRILAERLKETLQYEIKLRGHEDLDNAITYTTDTMIHVEDAVCNIAEDLWVESCTFNYSKADGPTTTLRCWRPGAYVI